MRRIDVLWLVEHVAREMDVACAVKCLAEARHGIEVVVRLLGPHAHDVMREYAPNAVALPHLYQATHVIGDLASVWPGATYFNLAWEQILQKGVLRAKAPGDEFTRERAIHHAWGDFYRDYLLQGGVRRDHIFVNGNPVYQLYRDPYKRYFKQREQLAHQYGLDPGLRWVFIPENYKWAFYSHRKLRGFVRRGEDLAQCRQMRAFCQDSLAQVLHWCNRAAGDGRLEIIFRPRPVTQLRQMEEFLAKHVGRPVEHLHLIKDESVREWILASDVVMSSYSTSLIEAAVSSKPIYMVEPIPIPEPLQSEWYAFVPRVGTGAEFRETCLEESRPTAPDLRRWAEEAMLSNGDPIEGLADFVGSLVGAGGSPSRCSACGQQTGASLVRPLSLTRRAGRRGVRMAHYSLMALESLLSAVKLVALHFAALLGVGIEVPGAGKGGSVASRVAERVRSAARLVLSGLRASSYFNPFTHESDALTKAEVQATVEAWRQVLSNG